MAGVGGGAARDDDDAVDAGEQLVEPVELGDHDLAVADAAADRVGDGLGLLGDLLGHEATTSRPSRRRRHPTAPRTARPRPALPCEVGDRDAVGGDRDDLVLPDRERVAGVLDERGDIGAEEVLALAEADHERRVAAGADDEPGLVLVHREQRERALEAADDGAERGDEVAAVPRYSRPSSTAATSVSVSLRNV